jgi:hypothetical protein
VGPCATNRKSRLYEAVYAVKNFSKNNFTWTAFVQVTLLGFLKNMNTSNHSHPVFQPALPLGPGESPRAYSAFMIFFQLGHGRSLRAVAHKLGASIDTIKKWSSRFDWHSRIQSFNAQLLQQRAGADAAFEREQAALWSARMAELREQQWNTAQKLLAVVQCYLENFGDEQLEKTTLSQVTRALVIASKIGRMALAGIELPEKAKSVLSPSQTRSNSPKPSGVPAEVPQPPSVPAPIQQTPSQSTPPLSDTAKSFPVPYGAVQCHLTPTGEVRPTVVSLSTADPRPSTLPSSPPSRLSREIPCTQKYIFSAGKCRKVPFGTTERSDDNKSPARPGVGGYLDTSAIVRPGQSSVRLSTLAHRPSILPSSPPSHPLREPRRSNRKNYFRCRSVPFGAVRCNPPEPDQSFLAVDCRPSTLASSPSFAPVARGP